MFKWLLLMATCAVAGSAVGAEARVPASDAFFEAKIRPLLATHCYDCHGEKKQQAGMRLDSRAGMVKAAVIVPGNAADSKLVAAVRQTGELKMPPTGKLRDEEIFALVEWINAGAQWPERAQAKPRTDPANHWAFHPLKNPPPPTVKAKAWVKNPIDAFVLAAQEQRGLKPNRYADRGTLIRRAYLDLIGLPPTPDEVEAFVNDQSAQAWERVIDRLLASPHYGERWGRHWLDLARFAESHGYEQDYDRPNAYHYRDFVIKALNADLPYDTFIRWQLAGDEFAPDDPLAMMATGFLAAGTHATQITKNQVEKERYDELDDKLATTGTVFLGLTFGCARCHDHKFDAIPQADYYRMVSTFTKTVRSDYEIDLDPAGLSAARAQWNREHAPLVAALQQFEQTQLPARFEQWLNEGRRVAANVKPPDNVKALIVKPVAQFTAADRAALAKWYATIDPQWQAVNQPVQDQLAKEPKTPKVLICSEGVTAVRTHTQGGDFLEATHFLHRGDPNRKDWTASQSFLSVLMRAPERERRWQEAPPTGARTSYQRRAFANWLIDVDAGAGQLAARVIVNRLWQHHFGRGLVATPSDFGTQGEAPTHPELLDWLARDLIGNGWKLKRVHKMMLLSASWQQSARLDPAKAKVDPDNRLLTHFARRRLQAEVIRDSMLSVSGLLDRTQFGPGTLDESMRRRSLYFFVKRSRLVPTMMLFDAPNALGSLAVRPTTTIAPQALMLLNNAQVRNWSEAFAKRVSEGVATPGERVNLAYRLALGRAPSPSEVADATAFLRQTDLTNALIDFCQVLFGLNEFVYVE